MTDIITKLKEIEWNNSASSRSKNVFDPTFCPHMSVRIVEVDPESEFEVHEHSTTQILYFVNGGEGLVKLDLDSYPIEKDMVVMVNPGVCHGVKNTGKTILRVLVFEEKMKSDSPQTLYVDF